MDSNQVRENLEGTGQVDGFFEAVKLQFELTEDHDEDRSMVWESSKLGGLSQNLGGEHRQDVSQNLFALDLDGSSEGGQENDDSSSVELDPNFTWDSSASSVSDTVSESDVKSEPTAVAPGGDLQRKRPFYSHKMVLLSCFALALAALGTVSMMYWKSRNTLKPARQIVLTSQGVRHPVPIPLYERNLEFLFLSASLERRDLLSLGVELELEGNESRDFYSLNELLFRETIYTFLLRQKPSQNTYRSWQGILEKDLPEHLANTLPQCRIRSFTILKLERL